MKKKVYFLLVTFMLSMITVTAQDIPGGLINAFKKGNAEELTPYLGSKVELIISNGAKEYDNLNAQKVMNSFFTTNKVSNFIVNHQGQRDESNFIIGTLTTNGGIYRINCFSRKAGNQYLVYQIRIDKTNE